MREIRTSSPAMLSFGQSWRRLTSLWPSPRSSTERRVAGRPSGVWRPGLGLLGAWLCCLILGAGLALAGNPAVGPKGPTPDAELGVLRNRELAAVQRPLFPKTDTVEVGLITGLIPNDPFVLGLTYGLNATWYRGERLGLGLGLSLAQGWDTWESLRFQQQGIRVDAFEPTFVGSLEARWVPVYAKLNLLGVRVVHFDTALVGGAGAFLARRMIYEDKEAAEGANLYNFPLSVNAGLSQRFYFRPKGRTMTLQLEARDHLYLQQNVDGARWLKHNWVLGVGVGTVLSLQKPGGKK